MDTPADILFSDLWLLDTYAKERKNKDKVVRKVWNGLDGTRGLQYTRSESLPGGFKDRVFDVWITWNVLTSEDGKRTFIMAATPLSDWGGTKYGWEGKFMKASTRGVHIIKEVTEQTCEWTKSLQGDLKIPNLPRTILDFVAKQQLKSANEMWEKYKRNGREVDVEKCEYLAGVMKVKRGEELMEDQKPVFKSCMQLLEDGNEADWKALASSKSPDVEMSIKYFPPDKDERSVGTGKAVGVVDCSAEEVAAFVMDFCSNERMRVSKEKGNPARLELREKARWNENTFAFVRKNPIFLNNREFVFRMFWKSEEGKAFVIIESVDDIVDYGSKLKKTRAFTNGLWQIEDLPMRGGAKQCRVTYINQIDAGGSIPTWLVNKQVPQALGALQSAIDEFRQDEKVDAVERSELAALIKTRGQDEVYSKEEERILEEGKATMAAITGSSDLKVVPSGDQLVSAKLAYLDGDKLLTGIGECVIEGEMEELAAFEWLKMSRESTKNFHKKGGVEKFVKHVDSHKQYYTNTRDLKAPGFKHREWRVVAVWKKEGENKIITCYDDTDALDEEHPRDPNVVAASARNIWEFERLPEVHGIPQTRVKMVPRVDVAGSVPTFFLNLLVKNFAKSLFNMRKKFDKSAEIDARRRAEILKIIKTEEVTESSEALAQFEALAEERKGWERPARSLGKADSMRLVPLKAYGVEDGRALGFDLLWRVEFSNNRVERLKEVFEMSRALRESSLKYPWIKATMIAALEGSVSMNKPVRTKLVCVSEKEAAQIGRNLVPSLMTEQLAEAGVNLWKVQNRAVKELMVEQVWFEPMAVVLGKGIVKTAAWGLMARVIVGALLSMTDLSTDMFVLYQFWEGGEKMATYRDAQLASLAASIAIQLGLVFIQNQKKGVLRCTKESLIVLCGLKPALDAFRVAMGYEQELDTLVDPVLEMTFFKMTEVFSESLPSIVIQTSAILSTMNSGGTVSMAVLISLLSSVLTTGFVSASISYDMDTNPGSRASNPDVYGFMPDSALVRALLFFEMIIIGGTQTLLKVTLIVILGSIAKKYVIYYLVGDLGVYLLYKVAHRDFLYWLKIYGLIGWFLSLMVRVIVKVVVDFTSCVHFRHPLELGGLYFTVNTFVPLMALTVVLSLDLMEENFTEEVKMTVKNLVIVAGTSLTILVSLLFALIDPEKSDLTGSQICGRPTYQKNGFRREGGSGQTRSGKQRTVVVVTLIEK
ncbi:hypothetical protein TL16_g04977 [Triparma laevis f. inornata]|uniref:START domain-containing protein n=1 Tax=Triparma laevis f. inornata TaxID=1714386 RepID=A0A9W7E862_9STRA|nr:hypothetical protein TL16_g04977 [Triparma laevis f. inornata]